MLIRPPALAECTVDMSVDMRAIARRLELERKLAKIFLEKIEAA